MYDHKQKSEQVERAHRSQITLKLKGRFQKIKRQTLSVLLIISLLLSQLTSTFVPLVYAASSPWTQTDWSGGVGASTTNQYSSASSADATTTSGQVTLTNTEKLSNTGFETDLTGWTYAGANNMYDAVPSITAAYGMRRLRTAYTGSILRIRRSSDNTEQDIGYTATGDLDTSAISTFIGGGSGYIVKWYDQSGNAYDASQTTTASQPLYVASGQNSRPVGRWDGVDDFLSTPSMTVQHIIATILPRQQNIYPGFIGSVGQSGVNQHGIITETTTNSFYPYSTTQYRVNASSATTLTFGSFQLIQRVRTAAGVGVVNLGRDTEGGTFANSDIAELIIANTALSDSNRQTAEAISNAYWNVFSVTAPVRDTVITYSSSAGSAKIVTPSASYNYTQSVNVGDTNSYNLVAYAYTDGSSVTSSDVELLYNGSTVSTTYTSVGAGWYKLAGTVTGVASSVTAGVQVKASKTVYIDNLSLKNYASSGTLTSNIFDTGQGSNWGTLTYTATTPTNTTVTVKARTSNDSGMSGATAFSSCNAITSGTDISSNNCVTDTHRYIQYQVTLATSSTEVTPTFSDISIPFTVSDADPPSISLTALSPDPNSDNTPTLSGTATEAIGTVSTVQFQMDSTAGSWSSCTASDGTFNSASEAFSCTAASLSDGSHTMNVRATDSNGNTTANGSVTTDTFTIDTTAPTTPGTPSTTSPTADSTPIWTWTASTDSTSGLAATPYTVEWSQSSSFSSGVSSGTSATNSFTHTTPLSDGTWYFRVKATDVAGNESSNSSNGSVQINTGAPTGTISINSGAGYTNTRSVTLTLSASSGFFSSTDDIDMKVSNLSDLSDASYEDFATNKVWTLISGDGTKTVYVQFRDTTGNQSGAYSDTIVFDATAPADIELKDPDSKSYTRNERPDFRWKATTDATSGLSKYKVEIDNGDSGDFTIDDIPVSRTEDYETSKYKVTYENFDDGDSSNNSISVHTKSSVTWGGDTNDGKLKEGARSWTVKAVDNAGNEKSASRTLFVDTTSPSVSVTQLNSTPATTSTFSTTDKTPTIFGKVLDQLAGTATNDHQDEDGPKVASGPKQVEVQLEKKEGLTYKLISLTTLNLDTPWYTCTNIEVPDSNKQQKCDKYLPFEFTPKESLGLGTYRITFTGKDKVDNTSEKIIITLNVTTLAQITTTEEKKVIEEETRDLTPKQKETLEQELEITKTDQPAGIEKTSSTIGNLFVSIKNGLKTTALAIGSGLSFAGRGIYDGLAWVGTGVGHMAVAFGNGLAYIGSGIGKGVNTLALAIADGYNHLANRAPGVLHDTMVAFGNGVGEANKALGTLASNIGNSIRNTGSTIAQGVRSTAEASQEGVTTIAFYVGEKTQDVSGTVGIAIIKFTYNFVPEPTRISDVQAVAVGPTSVKITWQTNHPANGKVNYGFEQGIYGSELQTDKRTTHHEFTLTDLKPDTRYHYEVMSQNKNYVYDANREFQTPAE